MLIPAYSKHPLVQYLREPEIALTFETAAWESLLRAARHGSLLSRVAWLATQNGLMDHLPAKIQFHFQSALRVAQSQAVSVNWEVAQIKAALSAAAIPVVLLKGAAYIKGSYAPASGRLLSDIDIMVPKGRLDDAERAFCKYGWLPSKLDPYDQRYYREWMHELPPMRHLERGTTLDLHHTILPPTALLKPDVDKLWKSVVGIENEQGLYVLSSVDMVLHSATHLFHDGELEHGLRDLVDMDALIREFSGQSQFFERLIERAVELNLERPLFYALTYCKAFLGTPIPLEIFSREKASGTRSIVLRTLMGFVVPRSLGSILEVQPSVKTKTSQFAMYVRSHYLRMPLHLLLPHLLRKQFSSDQG